MACILGYAALAYACYAALPGALTGAFLGLGGAWIGLTVQHCANHGAMSTSPLANNLLGMTDDLIGGSSLMWRYHHQARCCNVSPLFSYDRADGLVMSCLGVAPRALQRHCV